MRLEPQPQRTEQTETKPKPTLEIEKVTQTLLQLPLTRQEVILTAAIIYERLNQLEKLFAVRRNKQQRPIIEEACDSYGVEDINEHKHLIGVLKREAPNGGEEEVLVEIIRERKSSRGLNTVAAEQLLRDKGLLESCTSVTTTYVFDEEKIIEAYEANKISASELDSIFSDKVYYATKVKTDDDQVERLAKLREAIEKGKTVSESEMPTIESQ